MKIITPELLKKLAPEARNIYKDSFAQTQEMVWKKYNFNTQNRQNHFLAQLLHESTNLTRYQENLNYSAKRMMQVWPSRFRGKPALAASLAHNPKALANNVYGGRMGNTGPDDGWIYRGRGPIQITGKDMYRKIGNAIGIDLVSNPDLAYAPQYALEIAAYVFAVEKKCLPLADINSITRITRAINGGQTGLADRISEKAKVDRILGN